MTELAIAGIVLFAVALTALAVGFARRLPPVVRALRARGIRGALLDWATGVRRDGAGLP